MPRGGLELGSFLAQMIETGQIGYGREATGAADDWSSTVDDLLNVTAAASFTYSRGFKAPQPRGVTAIAWSSPHPSLGLHPLWSSRPPPSGGRPDHFDDERPAEGHKSCRGPEDAHQAGIGVEIISDAATYAAQALFGGMPEESASAAGRV